MSMQYIPRTESSVPAMATETKEPVAQPPVAAPPPEKKARDLDEVVVLVTGYRGWTDVKRIAAELGALEDDYPGAGLTLVHGGCAGADLMAARHAENRGWTVIEEKADWDKHGRRAGPIRNQRMIDVHKPDVVLAFLDPLSRGTLDCLRRAREYAASGKKLHVDIRVVNA